MPQRWRSDRRGVLGGVLERTVALDVRLLAEKAERLRVEVRYENGTEETPDSEDYLRGLLDDYDLKEAVNG